MTAESGGAGPPVRAARAARNRLLPEGRLTGPMPWFVAIMIFLTVLASAMGMGLAAGMMRLQDQLADRLTVQLVEANGQIRQAGVERLARALRVDRHVTGVHVVPDDALAAQLRPWLGEDVADLDLPVPALIDVTLAPGNMAAGADAVRALVRATAPRARVDADAGFLAPVERLMRSLMWLSVVLVVLMACATGAVVVLASRGAHDANRETIEILHLLGSTDAQIARLFQRRMALDALFGGAVGFLAAVAALLVLGHRVIGSGSELAQFAALPAWGWAVLPAVPLAGALLAMVSARVAVRRTLEHSL